MSGFAKAAAKTVFALADPFFGPFPGPRILIYHQVGTSLGREMELPTDTFRRQLDWMQEHGQIVDLETAVARRGEPAARKMFVLTFDDGYEDTHQNAFPLLQNEGLPFTLYLTTQPIETGLPLNPSYPEARPLTWSQVNEMLSTGLVTIGAHTHSHPDLRRLSKAEIDDELDRCRSIISDRAGRDVRHFAYPKGFASKESHEAVTARFNTGALGSGPPITKETSPLGLSRVPIQNSDGMLFFRRKLRTGMRLEDLVRRRLKQYRGP